MKRRGNCEFQVFPAVFFSLYEEEDDDDDEEEGEFCKAAAATSAIEKQLPLC